MPSLPGHFRLAVSTIYSMQYSMFERLNGILDSIAGADSMSRNYRPNARQCNHQVSSLKHPSLDHTHIAGLTFRQDLSRILKSAGLMLTSLQVTITSARGSSSEVGLASSGRHTLATLHRRWDWAQNDTRSCQSGLQPLT